MHMSNFADGFDLNALSSSQKQLLKQLLPYRMYVNLSGFEPLTPEQTAAIHKHLKKILPTLRAVVPHWLRDTILSNHPKPVFQVNATTLLADVSGFTTFTAERNREGADGVGQLTSTINTMFEALLRGVFRYGGDVLAFGGDAVLAMFTDAQHAATAAWEMRADWERIRQDIGLQGDELQIKIGLATGSIALVDAGTERRRVIFALGTVLNTLEALTPSGLKYSIRVDQPTAVALNIQWIPATDEHPGVPLLQPPAAVEPLAASQHFDPSMLPAPIAEVLALAPYLPHRVLQALTNTGDGRPGDGRYRYVTNLFLHLYDPEAPDTKLETAVVVASQALEYVLEILNQFNGTLARVDAYKSGLKVLVLFGAPYAEEHATLQAVRAAIELRKVCSLKQGALGLHLRAGITRGPVFAGLVGGQERFEYTVLGDSINLAARLMTVAEPGMILLDGQVVARIERHLEAEQHHYAIRSFGERWPVWSVSEMRDTASVLPHPPDQLVGREYEVAVFHQAAEQLRQGQRVMVWIEGEAGLGKTRLIQELPAILGDLAHIVVVEPLPNESYSVFIRLLRAITNLGLDPRIGVDSETHEALRPLLDPGQLPASAKPDDIQAQQAAVAAAFAQHVLPRAARRHPIAIVIENLQDADQISLNILRILLGLDWDSPVLLCSTCRPGLAAESSTALTEIEKIRRIAERTFDRNLHILTLRPLRDGMDSQLLDRLLPGLDGSSRREILDQAGGNPLHLDVIAAILRHSGALAYEAIFEHQRLVHPLSQLQTPDRLYELHDLITMQLDLLAESARDILDVAAVLGAVSGTFTANLLDLVVDQGDGEETDRQIAVLERGRIIERVDGQQAYRFRHALFQKAAYDSISKAACRALHNRAALATEQQNAAGNLAPMPIIAEHYFQGGANVERIISTSLEAGRQAWERYDQFTAGRYLKRVHSYGREHGDVRAELVAALLLAEIEILNGGYQRALDALETIVRSSNRPGHDQEHGSQEVQEPLSEAIADSVLALDQEHAALVACAFRAMAHSYSQQSRYTEAAAACEHGLAIAHRYGIAPSEICRIYEQLAEVLMQADDLDEALNACRNGLAITRSDPIALLQEQLELRVREATIYFLQTRVDLATQHFAEVFHDIKESGNLYLLAKALNNLGTVYDRANNIQEALNVYRESVEIKKQISDVAGFADTLANLGGVLLYDNPPPYEEISFYLDKAVHICSLLGRTKTRAMATLNLGIARFRLDQLDIAEEAAQEALSLARQIRDDRNEAFALYLLGDFALAHEDAIKARHYGESALAVAQSGQLPEFVVCANRVLGQALLMSGDIEGADAVLSEVWEAREKTNLDTGDLVHINITLAQLALTRCDGDRFYFHLEEGRKHAHKVHMTRELAILDQLAANFKTNCGTHGM